MTNRRQGMLSDRSIRSTALASAVATTLLLLVVLATGYAGAESTRTAPTRRLVTVGGPVTEAVFAVGAGGTVVAVDTTSVFPPDAVARPKVGYLRNLSAEGLLSFGPTALFVSGEAGPPGVLEQVGRAGVSVHEFKIEYTPEAAVARVIAVGRELGRTEQAEALAERMRAAIAAAREEVQRTDDAPRVLFLVNPPSVGTPLAAGRGTAAASMAALAGGVNAVDAWEGYRPLTPEAAVAAAPDVIVLPEGTLERSKGSARFLDAPGLAETPAGRSGRVVEVEAYSLGFGPRLGEAIRHFAEAIRAPASASAGAEE